LKKTSNTFLLHLVLNISYNVDFNNKRGLHEQQENEKINEEESFFFSLALSFG